MATNRRAFIFSLAHVQIELAWFGSRLRGLAANAKDTPWERIARKAIGNGLGLGFTE
jgi:hypothetical protein